MLIEQALLAMGRRMVVQAWQPGISEETVRDLLHAVGLVNSSSVGELWGWHDGTVQGQFTLDDIHVFPGFYFMSSTEAVDNYARFRNDTRWQYGWLPLFANGAGDFYFADLSDASPGQIGHFRIEEAFHPIEFASLEDMIHTWAVALDHGVIYQDERGYLEMSDGQFADLAAVLNPTISWWRD